jgi:hypothetical protein
MAGQLPTRARRVVEPASVTVQTRVEKRCQIRQFLAISEEQPEVLIALARSQGGASSAFERLPERYRYVDQWGVLLRPVDVRITDAAGVGGPLDGDLDPQGRVEEDHVVDVLEGPAFLLRSTLAQS